MRSAVSRRGFLEGAVGLGLAMSAAQAQAVMAVRGAGQGRRILILGAGMAGLAAGLKLVELGYDVLILEARAWPGGRVHTLREPFSDGLYAEAGAGRLPGTHGLTYIYEKLATEYSTLTPAAQIERTLSLYEQIHPGVRQEFETATTWSWLNEKYSKGAYLVAPPGSFGRLAYTATVEGRLHFAGEHTSPWPGWIQGALHSGLRTANEVASA